MIALCICILLITQPTQQFGTRQTIMTTHNIDPVTLVADEKCTTVGCLNCEQNYETVDENGQYFTKYIKRCVEFQVKSHMCVRCKEGFMILKSDAGYYGKCEKGIQVWEDEEEGDQEEYDPETQRDVEPEAQVSDQAANSGVHLAQDYCALRENGKCIKCVWRSVNLNDICTPVSDQCAQWDMNTGICTKCYDGYFLSKGQCLIKA